MASTVNLNIRVDENLKRRAESIFNELGMNLTTALNLFLRSAVRYGGVPFDLRLEQPEYCDPTANWTPKQWARAREMLAVSEKQFENGEYRDGFEVLKEARGNYGL
jgi:addiction module RelB/DinJ family antitoxin